MFEVNELLSIHQFKIIGVDAQRGVCLHSDGSILTTSEYWPTREQAQAVLDEFQPKHVWKHGDVFRWTENKGDGSAMIHLELDEGPVVYTLVPGLKYCINYHPAVACPEPIELLADATFLFNIKTIIKDKL